jgi:hypothetical protein
MIITHFNTVKRKRNYFGRGERRDLSRFLWRAASPRNDKCRLHPAGDGRGLRCSLSSEVREQRQTRLSLGDVPRVAALILVLRQPYREGAGLRAVGLHLDLTVAHVSAGRLLAVDVSLAESHESGDVTGDRPSGLGAAEQFQETTVAALEDQEGRAVHAVGIGFLGPLGDGLERIAGGGVVGDKMLNESDVSAASENEIASQARAQMPNLNQERGIA